MTHTFFDTCTHLQYAFAAIAPNCKSLYLLDILRMSPRESLAEMRPGVTTKRVLAPYLPASVATLSTEQGLY